MKKRRKSRGKKRKSSYQAIKPEIRINPEYFKKAGIPLEDEEPEEDVVEGKKEIPEVTGSGCRVLQVESKKKKDNKKEIET